METTSETLSVQTRAYFLQQGQSIGKLYNILSSNILVHHFKKWISIFFEVVLYVLFIAIVVSVFSIPTYIAFDAPVNENTNLQVEFHNGDLAFAVFVLWIVLGIAATPILMFAILLGRNRRKKRLIRDAFVEVTKMKDQFDQAVGSLKL